jgi:hypothetical protein
MARVLPRRSLLGIVKRAYIRRRWDEAGGGSSTQEMSVSTERLQKAADLVGASQTRRTCKAAGCSEHDATMRLTAIPGIALLSLLLATATAAQNPSAYPAGLASVQGNPSAPRVVQKFSGVVKWLQDERDFVYVLNGEGLWVVSKPADRQREQSESSPSYGG